MAAKKKEAPKPLFPLKPEFYASLDNFVHQAGMLADSVRQLIDMGAVNKAALPPLRERLDAFNAARFEKEDR